MTMELQQHIFSNHLASFSIQDSWTGNDTAEKNDAFSYH